MPESSVVKVEIFDPPMCCPTGICGPTIDPVLLDIQEALLKIQQEFNGQADVERYLLSQQAARSVAFTLGVAEQGLLSDRWRHPVINQLEKLFLAQIQAGTDPGRRARDRRSGGASAEGAVLVALQALPPDRDPRPLSRTPRRKFGSLENPANLRSD